MIPRTILNPRRSRWNQTRIFPDSGDEDEHTDTEEMIARTDSGRRTKASSLRKSKVASLRSKTEKLQRLQRLPEDLVDQYEYECLNLLDRQKKRLSPPTLSRLPKNAGSDDEPEIDAEGRLVVREGWSRSKKQKTCSSDHECDKKSQSGSRCSAWSVREESQKRRKTSDSGWAYTGSMYTSKKAAGDVKKKDKLDPYAYWPLDRKLLNRRAEHKAAARNGMAGVMKIAKVLEGTSLSGALTKLSKKKRKQRS